MKITFPGALTLVFIALKLLHHIEWSWWWVLSPALLSLAIWCGMWLAYGVTILFEGRENRALVKYAKKIGLK